MPAPFLSPKGARRLKGTKKYIKDYPRPQFVRDGWLCLNGEWVFDSMINR